MLVTNIISPFPAMFSTLSETNFAILATFKFSSANALNLDESKILLCGKELTLSQMTNFRLFQNDEFADDNFKFGGNVRKFSERVENTVGKGEIARGFNLCVVQVF